MPKVSALRKGMIVQNDAKLYAIRQIVVQTPSARGASTLYKIRLVEVQTQQKLDLTCKGDDSFQDVQLTRRAVEFSYSEGDMLTFLDSEDYSQYSLLADELADGQQDWLSEGLEGITVLMLDEAVLGIELPASVNLEIIDTAPAIKGASATSRTKPATLSTGVIVQIPEYLAPGEVISVSTETGKYLGRA